MSSSLSKAEKSYIQIGILSTPPSRADGRSLHAYRNIALQTGVAPLANGSARLSIGKNPHDGSGGTEVLGAVKLEVETVGLGAELSADCGRVVCTVTCSPSAYPYLPNSSALDDLAYDYTSILSSTFSHPSLLPSNLSVLKGKKSWLLHLDLVVLADSGNIYDALFMTARAAFWDTKVPRTRGVEYKARKGASSASAGPGASSSTGGMLKVSENMDVDQDIDPESGSGFDTRHIQSTAMDFELPDYWDEGELLDGRGKWPICVTLNLIPSTTPAHFLDATAQEESATPLRLLLMFAFGSDSDDPSSSGKGKGIATKTHTKIQAMRTLGSGELKVQQLGDLIKQAEPYALEIWTALNAKLGGSRR